MARSPTLSTALLLTAAAAVLILPMLTAGFTLEYKQKRLSTLTASGADVVPLDLKAFDVLTEAPRNYSIALLLTAMDPAVGCNICHQFDPEFRAAAYSWAHAKGKTHPLHFAVVDFATGREIYAKLRLSSAPSLYFYPATEGPHALESPGDNADFIAYDLTRRGVSGQALVQWLGETTKDPFTFATPPDYTTMAIAAVGTVLAFLLRSYIFLGAKLVLLNKRLYAAASILAILMFTGGTMWNSIRNPPLVGSTRNGQPEYIAQGLQTQHGIETQISAVLHGLGALAVVVMTNMVPKTTSATSQRVITTVALVLLVASFSLVMKVFVVKSPGYPFRMLL
ncbi:hypothetical protein BC828DRAFT_394347 [Blastocladiella britannica]|nr:hypothetical protein BC828DRAFT_394347 [Blastocladiella britannica]